MNPYMDPNMYPIKDPIKDPITAMGFVNHLGQKLDNLINHVHKKEVFYSLKRSLIKQIWKFPTTVLHQTGVA